MMTILEHIATTTRSYLEQPLFVIICSALGYAFGRISNLRGRMTDVERRVTRLEKL